MSIHHSKALVSDDFDAMNQLIIDKIQAKHELTDNLAHHIIQSGGKRLRPLLVLLCCQACEYEGSHHILLAAMIEFFHTATLLHDDVVDESTLRRGRQTAHGIWGSKASILVGDYLFTLYMQLMITIGNLSIMALLTDVSHQVARGELLQLSNQHNDKLSTEEYYAVIQAKTSLLFAASAASAAMLADADESIVTGLYTYGLHLGNAFQLIDDAMDYCSDTQSMGKNIGDDLASGKVTLPLLYALEHSPAKQQETIRFAINQGGRDYLPQIIEALTATNAIAFTRNKAQEEVTLAITALGVLPDSAYKQALTEIAWYAIDRNN